MDPHWNAAYGRLPHGTSIPTNPNPLSRYDLLEQSALTGLGLSPPLPAHSSHPQARGFGGLPNYGHHIPAPVGHHQLLDSAFAQGFVGQSPYKTVPVGQPGYGLDSSRSLSEHTARAPSSSIQMSKSVFKETFPSSSSAITQASEASKGWSLSNFLPQPSTPFSLATELVPPGYPNVNPPPAHSGMLKQTNAQPTILHISDASLLSYADTLIAQSKVSGDEPAENHQVKGGFIEQGATKSTYADNQGQSRGQFADSVKGVVGDHGFTRTDSVFSKTGYLEKQLQHDLYGRQGKELYIQQQGLGSYGDFKPSFTDTYTNPIKEYSQPSPSMQSPQPNSPYVNTEVRPRSSSFSEPRKESGISDSPSNTVYSDPSGRYHSSYDIPSTASSYNSYSHSPSVYSSSVITSSMSDRYDSVSPPERPVTDSRSTEQDQYNSDRVMLQQQQASSVSRKSRKQSENLVMQTNQQRQAVDPVMAFNQVLQASVITEPKRPLSSSVMPTPSSNISAPPQHSPQRSSSHSSPLNVGSPSIHQSQQQQQQQSQQQHYPIKNMASSTVIQQQTVVPVQAVPDSTTSKPAAKPKRSRKKKAAAATVSESKSYVPVQPVAPMPAMIQPAVRGQDMVPIPPLQQMQTDSAQVMTVEPLHHQAVSAPRVQIQHSHQPAATIAQSTIDMQTFASLQAPSQPERDLQVPSSQDFASTSEAMAMYMTSTFGTGFVNPNDILAENMPLVVQNEPQLVPEEGQGSIMSLDSQLDYTAAGNRLPTGAPKRKPGKTKAEKKLMPATTSQICKDDDFDDEFAHLKSDPLGPSTHSAQSSSTSHFNRTQPNNNTGNPSHIVPTPPKIAKMPQTAFQDSFLGFLQGKKPETLSSVTTSAVVKKPQLPKYIPMETPRPQPQVPKNKKRQDSGDGRAFSDDDDSSQDSSSKDIFKTVQTVISNISDSDSKDESSAAVIDPFKGSILKQIKQQRSKKRKKQNKKMVTEVVSLGSGDEEVAAVEPEREPSPLPRRESLKRSAKVKLEEKRKKRHEKSSKRKKTGSDIDISDASEDDFIAITSEEEGYDSDKDPGWAPGGGEAVPKYGSDSDDDMKDKKRGRRGRGRGTAAKSRVQSVFHVSEQIPQEKVIDISDSEESTGNPVHHFQRGEFVIKIKDLTNYKNFPIWKIDSKKLLQKYIAVQDHGKLVHKSLSTYSSWSDAVRDNYKPIQVHYLAQGKGYELVEVLEQFQPKDPAVSAAVNEEDPFLENFNTYLQILLSQALEENFISAMIEENDPFYLDPLNAIDEMLEKTKKSVQSQLNWKDTFKRAVEWRPYLSFTDTQAKGQHCQACEDLHTPAVKMVELYGESYNRKTLQVIPNSTKHKEFYIGQQASRCLSVYHGLHHFKFALFKRCAAKIQVIRDTNNKSLEGAEVLDQLLMNRTWVLQLFSDLKKLLSDADAFQRGSL
ncbi:uncharacterized protein LOC106168605 [Lingula anatina]|uniref:Uncharacterized protein LOC106168605 n=1 Tax=Lingula anatina TaxID=7574 RepID=A0A1S3IYU8_LINAN|nr:uncharacterized protein LOC106168605 [Lingula anatina]|eukprot:XP_013403188.1 uncharacterized protein LOC106168605 [Lingula anatina]